MGSHPEGAASGARHADWSGRRLHFVGIGGAGMSGLALVSQALGAEVTGSDRREGPFLAGVRRRGIEVNIPHLAEAVPDRSEIVFSSAVAVENPERARGRELGLIEHRRGALLAEVCQLRRCVAVAGTHGKTTTAAMIAHALRGAGRPVGYLIGGEPLDTGTNAEWSEDEWLVVETDESDRSLLGLTPELAVLTNVEHEHVRAYSSLAEVEAVFAQFLSGAAGAVVGSPTLAHGLAPAAVSTFSAEAVRLFPGGARFAWRGREVTLRVPGAHNVVNAAAALEACRRVGVDEGAAIAALAGFTGTRRRLERIGESRAGAVVYEDYAHHPTAVGATLEAARTLEPRRLVAVLQPHSYVRTRLMAEGFARAVLLADEVVLLDILQAGPSDLPPASTELVAVAAGRLGGGDNVTWVGSPEAARVDLEGRLRAGDVCVVMGPGEGTRRLAHDLVEAAEAD